MNYSVFFAEQRAIIKIPQAVKLHIENSTIKQLMRIGIVSFFILTTSIQLLSATAVKSQAIDQVKISVELKNGSLTDAFHKIEKQTPFHFMYRKEDVKHVQNLTISANKKSVAEVLKRILLHTSLRFRQVDNQILISMTDSSRQGYLNFPDLVNTDEQEINAVVKGRVTDTKGVPLAGVSVKVKGSSAGTSTDADGRYSISVPDDGTLVFTYIGFNSMEVAVQGRTTIDVVLKEESKALNEVVVTALGIKREAKRLGYSATSVNTDQLTVNRSTNVGNSLVGKVAGLNVSAPAAGPGSSSKIRIRGQSSFGGNNSPLIVVNGVPINNSSISAGGANGNGTGNPTGGSSDAGDGLQSINPDDIESMTVLKGAAAAALYGSRAKDGAIIITTKSGRGTTGIGIEYNSNFQTETALDFTDFQYEYGQGEYGLRPTTVAEAQSSGVFSFGERFDGKPTPQFDGSTQAYVPYKNRIADFYRTGINATNSISVSGGNTNGNFRLSFANTDAKSIMPNSAYHRKVLNLGLNYNLTKKLSTQVNANYSNEYNKNPPQIGIQDMSANTTIYTMATSIDADWLKNRKDENGNEMPLSRFTNRNNPYWVAYDRFENVRRDRIFGNVSLRYQFNDWLYAQGRFGQDYFTRPYDYNRPTGTRSLAAASTGFNGYYYQDITTFRERNMDFLIGAKHNFGKFGIDVTLGGNQMKQVTTNNSNAATNFYVRDLYTIMNAQVKNPQYSYLENRINSLYGSADFSYKNFLYLTVTGRNDWFSSLNPKSNNYLYPSVSSSFVFSDAFKVPHWLSYGKLRAAYAEVGGGTDPYTNNLYYSLNANTFNGVALGSQSTAIAPNPNLKPLTIKEAEAGLEMRMFNSRLNIDVAVYRKNTVNEILNVDISNASGYTQTKVNVGKLRNQGVEMLLSVVPVLKNDIRWESAFNGTYNKSEVLQLANNQARVDVGTGEFFGTVSHEVGMPLASLRGFDYRRDDQGRIITSGGLPLQGSLTTFGSAIPKWTGGWINNFNYKKLSISTQIDFKAGYKIMSNSNMNFLREGLSKASLAGREGGVVFPGVNADGTPNTTAVEAEAFYTVYRTTGIATPFMYNGSFIRWRSLTVGYDLSRYVNKSFIKGLTLSATVNNVLMIKKYIDNLDPEAQVSVSDNLQGIETHTLPTTRVYGLNLNVKL
ncbi:SusC/RagA family TonB-linked outer membrane protein [Rubrolithibacter danxiaensis]|uniref:SusC/RagA family TonB-linked outer membrane protein n=1 Tax=Rubrolithibacter danxiaensis TaxID=3390805 RepID=UPI003BF8A419